MHDSDFLAFYPTFPLSLKMIFDIFLQPSFRLCFFDLENFSNSQVSLRNPLPAWSCLGFSSWLNWGCAFLRRITEVQCQSYHIYLESPEYQPGWVLASFTLTTWQSQSTFSTVQPHPSFLFFPPRHCTLGRRGGKPSSHIRSHVPTSQRQNIYMEYLWFLKGDLAPSLCLFRPYCLFASAWTHRHL